ncbi:MAG: hypothetical protein EXR45_08765 [Chloroflexi bacterium]|nr:hypothetical protein [Chloroflexota bacterium]
MREKPRELTGSGSFPPGETVRFPGGRLRRVTTVYTCTETVGEIPTTWWWTWFHDGSLLEQTPIEDCHYTDHDLLPADAPFTRELVGPAGSLEQFEAAVRRAEVPGVPDVRVNVNSRPYRITATGTVTATILGDPPSLPPWHRLASPSGALADHGRHHGVAGPVPVYFALADCTRPQRIALGLWTDHVCLSFGRRLKQPAGTGPDRRLPHGSTVDAGRNHD